MIEAVDSDLRGWFPIGSPDGRRVLLIGDDLDALQEVSRALRQDGHMVLAVTGGVARRAEDLVDLDLAVLDGVESQSERIELFQLFADRRHLPVAVVDHDGSTTERLLWLALGAADVVPYTRSIQTLVDEIEDVLRRTRHPVVRRDATAADTPRPDGPGTGSPTIAAGGMRLNPLTRTLDTARRSVQLSRQECALVEFLLRHPGRAFDRDELLDAVWGRSSHPSSSPSTVTVQIRRIREKIEDDPSHPQLIRTVWGVGYCVSGNADHPSGMASHH